MSRKLWVSETEFVEIRDDRKTLSQEIATRKRSIDFYSLGMYLPNPDPVLKKQGKDIKIYKELLSDSHVGACQISRKAGVKSLEWEIDRGKAKSRQAKFIEDVFSDLKIYRIIGEILEAPFFGYKPLEVIWKRVGSYIVPADVVGKPPEWFVFDEENQLKFRTKENMNGEELPSKKFLLPRNEPAYENPYGFPVLSRCFWPVTFKRGGLKFWVMFTEKYGMPFLVGKYARGTDQKEIDRLADMLEDMIQDAIAVIPDDSSVDIKEASGKGASADIYERLLFFCNSEISKAILGQTLTTENQGKGSYAATKSHMEVRADIVDADKKLVEEMFNTLIKWTIELNFGSNSTPPQFSMYAEEDVDKDLADRDKTLADTGQIRFTKKYFMTAYGFNEDEIVVIDPQTGEPAEFSEPANQSAFQDQQAIDEMMNAFDAKELQKQMEDVLKPVIKMIQEGNSYSEVMENLASMFPEMDTEKLEETLAKAMFVAEVWGRLNE